MQGFEARLKGVCRHVVDDAARLKVYETDGLTAKRMLPRCVALPETLDEVQAIMALCYQENVPVVARGAGTGLSGGAMPHPEGVLLSLAKFNRVLEVDVNNRIARVEPGVTNLGITEAVRQHDLYYAPDPSSQIACTIGGNIAENSGGVHCLKYGLTVNNVRALKMVSPEGELYEVGNGGFDSPGFDLLALLHGSEGMLGIVVEVTVQLLQKPEALAVVLVGFDSVKAASETVAAIISEGLLPAGLEMMDKLAIEAAEDFVHAGYPRSAEALLLCELDGSESDVAAQLDQLRSLLEKGGATDIQVATEEAHRALLWQGRKSAFPAVGRIAPDYYCMDGTIPKRELADVLAQITALSNQYGLGVANVFHAGDGNLHPLILYDANEPKQADAAERFGADILELCIARGGTITGEHGVGVEKINEMCLQFSPLELSRFHQIKACFDETGLLNPGKAVPTLNRCAEFGAMHVHGGKLKHPELERFLVTSPVTPLLTVKELAEQIKDHASKRNPLRIVGGNSKHFYGHDLAGLPELSSASLSKIVSYEPSELVLRVEAGCPLATINETLRQEGQMLGFEPPDFGGSTIGGAIASGIAGSRRPFAGAGRDFLLGVGMIDGEGEVFSFGGQVMKNVAGYDVSRLMAGALGCLGFITEVSLKVLPMPALELSTSRTLSREQFLSEAKKLTALPEVTAVAWWQDKIHVRYSGSEQTVKLRVAEGGGDPLENSFWHQLDTLALFAEAETLQRISCKPMDQNSGLAAATLIDWAGAQRWIMNEVLTSDLRDAHATLVMSNDSAAERFAPLAPPIAAIHRKLKQTFDPKGILNPNKMYEGI